MTDPPDSGKAPEVTRAELDELRRELRDVREQTAQLKAAQDRSASRRPGAIMALVRRVLDRRGGQRVSTVVPTRKYDIHLDETATPTKRELNPCLCGCGRLTRHRFKPGHDQRHLGQCLNRISAGDPTGADDLERDNPGHAANYDMDCLRHNLGQKREVLRRCFQG